VRLLLDTHVAIWALIADRRLTARARQLISSPDNAVCVSAASVWEIAIKHSLGRSGLPFSGTDALRYFTQAGYELIPIRPEHAVAVETLPALHGDPFDRLLIAQAMAEPLRLLTHDPVVLRYSDSFIEV
jgi:PIN domain nuclease of toxin-antitoxin system